MPGNRMGCFAPYNLRGRAVSLALRLIRMRLLIAVEQGRAPMSLEDLKPLVPYGDGAHSTPR